MSLEYESDYDRELSNALEKCQFIEDTLRHCIISALDIARLQSPPQTLPKLKSEDIEKLPLGGLIDAFSKINDDTALHNDLKEFKQHRNDIAHRSRLFTIGELQDETYMKEKTRKMKDIVTHATDLHHRLLEVRWVLLRSLSAAKRTSEKPHP